MNFAKFMASAPALKKAMEERHSVRQYTGSPISEKDVKSLQAAIDALNEDHWTDIQLVCDEPRAFDCLKAKYGRFENATNYIVLVGPECKELPEVVGYAGEKLVLYAQSLGLNTCWVGASYKMVNHAYRVDLGNRMEAVISIGHGKNQGKPRRSVAPEKISKRYADGPDWFKAGIDASLLAPTALNQQKFRFDLIEDSGLPIPHVKARTKRGPFAKMDLGIAKLHFEIGAGPDSFDWA